MDGIRNPGGVRSLSSYLCPVISQEHILFEDKDLLIIDKPAGLQVERDRLGHPSLEEEAEKYLEKYHRNHYLGIVHRIDRPVNGVIILAKNLQVLKKLQIQIQEGKWVKIYRAFIEGKMPEKTGTLENYLLKDPLQKKAIIHDHEVPGSKKSILTYKVLEETADRTLLEIQLITGRYHQIRAQLGYTGHPIIGDELYGSRLKLENRILLQSWSIRFLHPRTGDTMEICSKTPLKAD